MEALRNILENPLLRINNSRKRADIINKFPELKRCSHFHFLSIHKYIKKSPQYFYSHSVYTEFFKWLECKDQTNKVIFKKYLLDNEADLNHAFLHLEEINGLDWHDYFEKPDDFELIRFVDQQIHPTYLRLTEAVFTPICRIIAYFSRIDRGKGIDNLNLYDIVEEIKKTGLDKVVKPYNHTVRNGIAHGGIVYLQKSILYRDKSKEEKLNNTDIIRTFDDLLDTCNALTLALSIFFLLYQSYGYNLPQQFLLNELKEEVRAPWWEVVGCTPSKITNINQLIIYVRSHTFDYRKVQISVFQTGILAEKFSPGYDRYFLSIQSYLSLPGFAAFDGNKLSEIRNNENSIFEDYKGVIEDNLIFFKPKIKIPLIVARIENIILSFKTHMPIIIEDAKRQFSCSEIYVREAKIHKNFWGAVLKGSVFVEFPNDEYTQDTIRQLRKKIIRKALREARFKAPVFEISRYLPLGFACISVFCKNYRCRRLSGFGLGAELVCTIQVKRVQRIQNPDISGGTIEILGGYRIVWNQAWLKENMSHRAY